MCLRLNQVRQFPSVSNRRNDLYLKSLFPSSKLPQTRQRSIVTSGSLQIYIKTFVVYFSLETLLSENFAGIMSRIGEESQGKSRERVKLPSHFLSPLTPPV